MMFNALGIKLAIGLTALGAYVAAPEISYGVNLDTQTAGPSGELVPTQEAYYPESKIALSDLFSLSGDSSLAMSNPEDLCLDEENDDIYVADTGNNRALKIDLATGEYLSFGEDSLKGPTGIYATSSDIYIANKGNSTLDVYDKATLTLSKSFARPTSVIFGSSTPYVPSKVVATEAGDVYLVSEGCSKGIVEFSNNGDFVGYVGANATTGNALTWFQNLFGIGNTTGFLKSGAAPTNVAIDSAGLVYTVTNKSTSSTIKKLNTSGESILSPSYNKSGTIQVAIDSSGNIYSVQEEGSITIYDSYGNLLFTFSNNSGEEILGSLAQPMALVVSSTKEIYILDKEYGMITSFAPTEFATLVYKAEDYYKDGLYLQGEDRWKEVLKSNSMFILAYKALARASMKRKDYTTALKQFKLAEDKSGYSEAYWEIRNTWLQANLGYVILGLAIGVALILAYKTAHEKRPKAFAGIDQFTGRVSSAPIVRDAVHMNKFYFHVRDGVYEEKFHKKGSLIFATVLYVWFVVIQILSVYLKGYLFNSQNVYNSSATQIILASTIPLLAFVFCNYFVATVTDGEGKLKYCYISFIYALTPYLIFALPIFLISRVLTYNESVVYNVLLYVTYGWSAINVFLTVQELHDYSFWGAVKNILLTVFAMFMLALFLIVIYMLGYQLYSYVYSIIKEARH